MPLGDLLKGTPLAGLTSGAGGIINTLGSVVLIVAVAGILVLAIWFWRRRKSYNIPTPIFSRRSGVLKFFMDAASYSKDKRTNNWDFRFKSLKEIASPPPYRMLLTGTKGNNVAVYYQNSAGELYPCEVEVIEPMEGSEQEIEVILPDGKKGFVTTKVAQCKMKIIEPDIALWSTQMDQKLLDTYGNKTWWDKYGNQVLFFGTATLVLVMIFLVLKKVDVIKEASGAIQDALKVFKSTGTSATSTAP